MSYSDTVETQTANSLAAKLALFAIFAAFVVIAFGAFTRLADAGLGCPDWPTCYGYVLWPETEAQIQQANAIYAETPVESDKTWPEQVHRLFASSLGFIALLLFGFAFRQSKDKQQKLIMSTVVGCLLLALVIKIALKMQWDYGAEAMHDIYDVVAGLVVLAAFAVIAVCAKLFDSTPAALKLSTFLVALVILQGLFGMWTVTLKVWPQVVTLHLLGGFSVVSVIWILYQRLRGQHWQMPALQLQQLTLVKPWAKLGLTVVVLQIALGGWTTSNYAAVACPDLPTCQSAWWPAMDFAKGFNILQEIGPNYLGGQMENEARVAIHMAHRIGAIITSAFLLLLFVKLLAVKAELVSRSAYIMLFVLIAQLVLGLSNIIFHFPLNVAVLHNAVGAVLLLVLVNLNYLLASAQAQP